MKVGFNFHFTNGSNLTGIYCLIIYMKYILGVGGFRTAKFVVKERIITSK